VKGFIPARPEAPRTGTANRHADSLITRANEFAPSSDRGQDWELVFRVSVPVAGVGKVCLVNGSYTINPLGAPVELPEASTYIVDPGNTEDFGPFAASAGPWHVLRESASVVDEADISVRTLFRAVER